MGKTISITIPNPLEEKYTRRAKASGISRSRYIGNILIQHEDKRQMAKEMNTQLSPHVNLESVPNDCENREDDGFCTVFEHICNAPQHATLTCSGRPEKVTK